ncbi:MAG: hypothetical protein H8D43_00080 [Chloroflexi bacterium]|nr:hypothetical protein [Chloroflexota bacterium]
MSVKIAKNTIIIGVVLQPSDFTGLVNDHLGRVRVPKTRELEHEASDLRDDGFPEEQLEKFIRNVCVWGNYLAIAYKVFKNNERSAIQKRFSNATNALSSDIPDVQGALREINQIKGLGRPSFASKHLRFLRPDVCPVLDSIISKNLGYALDRHGYKQFSDDCLRIAETLEQHGVANPMDRESGKWFAADVEMALYTYLRKGHCRFLDCLTTSELCHGE